MPMRILNRGRDAYLLAGYLDKRGKWTSSWSERYFVLTPTALYYFKKDRSQLFGDCRGKIPVESIFVRPLPKLRTCFELIFTNSTTNTLRGHPGAETSGGHHLFSGSGHKTRVLRAASEQECRIWIKAIQDAQMLQQKQITVAKSKNKTYAPMPTNATTVGQQQPPSPATITLANSNQPPVTITSTGLHQRKTRTPVPSTSTQPEKRKSFQLHTPTELPPTSTSLQRSHTTPRESPGLSPQPSPTRIRNHEPDPLLLVTIDHDEMSPEIVIGRNVPWGQMMYLGEIGPDASITATLADGTTLSMKSSVFSGTRGEETILVPDPYRTCHVRVRWETMTSQTSTDNHKYWAKQFVLPVTYLLLTAFLALFQPSIWTMIPTYPITIPLSLLLGCVLALHMLNERVHAWHKQLGVKLLKVMFVDTTLGTNTSNNVVTLERGEQKVSKSASTGTLPPAVTLPPSPIGPRIHEEMDADDMGVVVVDSSDDEDTITPSSNIKIQRKPSSDGEVDDTERQQAMIERRKMVAQKVAARHENKFFRLQSDDDGNHTDIGSDYESESGEDSRIGRIRSHAKHGDEEVEQPPEKEYAHKVPWGAWAESDMSVLVVRGINYMNDGIKVPATRPMMRLAHVDMFATNQKLENIGARNDTFAYTWYKQQVAAQPGGVWSKKALLSPILIINFVFPGKTSESNLICYFVRREKKSSEPSTETSTSTSTSTSNDTSSTTDHHTELTAREQAFERLYANFISGSDEFRNSRFKIIPRIAEGSWVVRKAIGHRPALLGQKIKCQYFHSQERNYFEISVDIGSSKIAGKILQLVKGYATNLLIDLSFLIQGECPEELPESLLGGMRLYYPDMDKFKTLEQAGSVHATSIV